LHYKSIFISDIHLGSRGCQADSLCSFLKTNTCENLFLVGDVIDGWQLRKRWFFPQSHANVIRRILTAAKRGTKVYYILGNHDEAFRKFLQFDIEIGNIQLLDRIDYKAINEKRYLIIHGDFFDSLMLDNKWLMHLGDIAYNFMIWVNIHFNKVRNMLGMEYWSLSKWLKQNTKEALNFINNFEVKLSEYCIEEKYDGIICGQIHVSAIKDINGIEYMNCGDWVESGTALLEHTDGSFEVIEYRMEEHEQDTTDY
jgi:UDP-2,3-diacylglucosamine pyrophosphatase LpxH